MHKKEEIFQGSHKPTKKYAMKMKQRKKRTHKNVIDGRKPFIKPVQKTGENDLHNLRVNDYACNEGSKWNR